MSERKVSQQTLASIQPMLAQSFLGPNGKSRAGKYLPQGRKVFYQPKLDGIRCLAGKVEGNVYLHSRNGEPITSMVHIQKELKEMMEDGEIWDGELYRTDLDFNELTHFIRPQLPVEGSERIEFHVFDAVIFDKNFTDRYVNGVSPRIVMYNRQMGIIRTHTHIRVVPTIDTLYDRDEMNKQHDEWVDEGYEGLMIRIQSPKGYECKRTSDLLKHKIFQDAEFVVIGYEQGEGKLVNHLGAFYLSTDSPKPPHHLSDGTGYFKAKPDGKQGNLARIWKERDSWVGKKVCVSYQNLSKYGIPRFPIVKGIRFDV